MIWNFSAESQVEHIFEACEGVWGLQRDDIRSRSRREPLPSARAIAMVCMRRNSNLSFSEIGRAIGREHMTVIYHCEQHEDRMETDQEYKENYEALQKYVDKHFGVNKPIPECEDVKLGYWIGRKDIKNPGGFSDYEQYG